MNTKEFLDYKGLKSYDELLKRRVETDIDTSVTAASTILEDHINTVATYSPVGDDKVLTGGVVKDYVDKKLNGVKIMAPVYYCLDPDGHFTYFYNPAEGLADPSITYYERVGKGSTDDPYRYVVLDPQPEPGTLVKDYFVRGDQQTTTDPTEAEKEYPVIDPETGEQVYQEITYIDDSISETIVNIMKDNATISEPEIIDLWV